jgi:hypothetical protein
MAADGSLNGLKREFGAVSFQKETYAEAAPATVSDARRAGMETCQTAGPPIVIMPLGNPGRRREVLREPGDRPSQTSS